MAPQDGAAGARRLGQTGRHRKRADAAHGNTSAHRGCLSVPRVRSGALHHRRRASARRRLGRCRRSTRLVERRVHGATAAAARITSTAAGEQIGAGLARFELPDRLAPRIVDQLLGASAATSTLPDSRAFGWFANSAPTLCAVPARPGRAGCSAASGAPERLRILAISSLPQSSRTMRLRRNEVSK